NTFYKQAPRDVRKRLDTARVFDNVGQTIIVNGYSITQNEKGWCVDETSETISEVVIRNDTIYVHPSSKRKVYAGHISYAGKQLAFTAKQKDFEKTPLKYARDLIVEAGFGVPIYRQTWQRHTFEIMHKFHRPVIKQLIDKYGWDQNGQR